MGALKACVLIRTRQIRTHEQIEKLDKDGKDVIYGYARILPCSVTAPCAASPMSTWCFGRILIWKPTMMAGERLMSDPVKR